MNSLNCELVMSIELRRSLKRAENYLEIVNEILLYKKINYFFENQKDRLDWIIANSDKMDRDFNGTSYGRDWLYPTKDLKNYLKSDTIYYPFKTFPEVLKFYQKNPDSEDPVRIAEYLREELLKLIQDLKERIEDISFKGVCHQRSISINLKEIRKMIRKTRLKSYMKNKKELKILQQNIFSLKQFKQLKNYKNCMIAMGSILEFLLKWYCDRNQIKVSGRIFVNYLDSAIDQDIFQKKKHWELVKSHLRDFRNYIHIEKEVNNEEIDQHWFEIIEPVLMYYLSNSNKINTKLLSIFI